MKKDKYILINKNQLPKLDIKENHEFWLNFQKALLSELFGKKLLTQEQKERCIDELIKQDKTKE